MGNSEPIVSLAAPPPSALKTLFSAVESTRTENWMPRSNLYMCETGLGVSILTCTAFGRKTGKICQNFSAKFQKFQCQLWILSLEMCIGQQGWDFMLNWAAIRWLIEIEMHKLAWFWHLELRIAVCLRIDRRYLQIREKNMNAMVSVSIKYCYLNTEHDVSNHMGMEGRAITSC